MKHRKHRTNRAALLAILLALLVVSCRKDATEEAVETPIPTAPDGTAGIAPEPTEPETGLSTFQLQPTWEVGDEISLVLVKERTDLTDGLVDLEGSSRTPVQIRVLEADEDGYLLQWTYGKPEVDTGQEESAAASEVLLSLIDGLAVEYEVDRSGQVIEVRNWEEIRDVMGITLDQVLEQMGREGTGEGEIAQVRAVIEPLFSSREQIEILAIQEIHVYHHLYGWPPLNTDEPTLYDDLQSPNPFGGQPFVSLGQYELQDFQAAAGQVTVVFSQSLEPGSTREILLQTLTDLALSMDVDPPTEADLPTDFTIDTSGSYVIDTGTGWVTSVEYVRTMNFEQSERVEATRFMTP